MPALKNLRHEKFVRGLVTGMSQRKAYLQAGYAPAKVEHADQAASVLSTSLKVEKRMDELLTPVVKKTQVTVASLMAEADAAMVAAARDSNHSAVIAALTLKAKLSGNLRDKIEVTHEYANLQTPDDVLLAIRRDLGETAAAMLLASMEEVPAPAPQVIEAKPVASDVEASLRAARKAP